MQCSHCVCFKQDHKFHFCQSQMIICDSERKETGTKSVAMARRQGSLLGPKLQLWCQVSNIVPISCKDVIDFVL